jgi:thiamine-phosphate pyrophosphorylase
MPNREIAVDLRLNAIVDPERAGGRPLAELARLCAEGGATLIQLRDKVSETRVMVETARAIKKALTPLGVPFVVNDRIDVALAAEADGVHVGPDDMAIEDARRLLGPNAMIGLSIKSVSEADAAPVDLLDYVGSGGVYVTLSKEQKRPPIGPEGLARIIAALHRRAPHLPVCGIAGIDASNAAPVIGAGADGVAVISALSLAPDPAGASRALRGIIDAALAQRVAAGPPLLKR